MTHPKSNSYAKPVLHGKAGRALLACGLWLRAGFVGASATIIGLIQLFEGETTPLSPLALTFGGVALAVIARRRAFAALERMGEPAAAAHESTARPAVANESTARTAVANELSAATTARTPAVA